MSRMTASSTLTTVLSVLVITGAASGAGPAAAKKGGIDGRELAELVARESFKSFGRSTEGTVVARFRDRDTPEPLGVWVYQKGALREAGIEKLDEALGADRGQWPPYTLLFAAFPEGSTWQLERRKGRWVLVGEAVTMNID
jgi:hypothetical protein